MSALETIEARPESKALLAALLDRLSGLGPYDVEVKKTSLHVTRGSAFLGVHPRSRGLLLNIVTSEPIDSARIRKVERVSANRYHNEVLLAATGDLDDELVGWLRQAYER